MLLKVFAQPNQSAAMAQLGRQQWPCVLGKNGVIAAADKREGDGCTPLGRYTLLYGLYRPDRVVPPHPSHLVWLPITPALGWCDDPQSPLYNQLVPAGIAASHEQLWRTDTAYDRVVVISHNLPAVAGLGSAVFIHQLHADKAYTAGCLAFTPEALSHVLQAGIAEIELALI